MRIILSLAIAIGFVLALPAAAQAPSQIMAHYRAYAAALERGDLAAAETEADAALGLSEARDGDGGRTAVLALNLATVRLQAGDAAGALAPGLRALSLGNAGASGVDPLLAELIVGRAELATQGEAGANRLSAVLSREDTLHLPAAEIYDAASTLGAWALREKNYALARIAWATAANHASGSPFGEAYAFGQARTAEAASIIIEDVGRRGRLRLDNDNAHVAYALLLDAQAALWPLSEVEAPDLALTRAQSTYALARAWYSVLRAKMSSDGMRLPEGNGEAQGDADSFSELGPVDLSIPRCLMRIDARPLPEYPREQENRGGLAGVVLRLRINEAGDVIENSTVARVGDEAFSEALERVAPRWHVVKRDDSPPNCRMTSTILASVSFVLR